MPCYGGASSSQVEPPRPCPGICSVEPIEGGLMRPLRLVWLAAVALVFASTGLFAQASVPHRITCTITGTEGIDELVGTAGSDVICGKGGAYFSDGPGADRISGGQGRDYNFGGLGNDHWYGGPDGDALTDFRGWDFISGGDGNDECLATADGGGHDTIIGGAGSDNWWADNVDDVSSVEDEFPCFAE